MPEIDTTAPGSLLQLGTAFCTSKLLLTALELNLFGLLRDGPADAEQICGRCGLHTRGAVHFLDALVALGVLRKSAGRYANQPAAALYLVPGEPRYVGGFLRRANDVLYPAWGRFTEALRTGEPQVSGAGEPYDTMSADPAELSGFLAMMDTMNGPLGPELAADFPWGDYGSVVDVGGARGNLIASIARAHPHLAAAVFDLPQMGSFFNEHMGARRLTGRVSFRPGNFFTDPLPEADVVVMGHVLHDWSAAERQMLVQKAFDAVRPGGVLLVYDPMLDEEHPALGNLVISLDMILTTRGGAEYTASDCRMWMEAAGFTADPPRRLGFLDTLMVGHKKG